MDEDICEVSPPGHRGHLYIDAEPIDHWRGKHPAEFAWQMAKLRDKREGFGWRKRLPEIDAWSDGLRPICGRSEIDGVLVPSGQKSLSGGEEMIVVEYCIHDGDIIRRVTY